MRIMIDHVSLGVASIEASRLFYDAALRPLGLVRTVDSAVESDYGFAPGSLGSSSPSPRIPAGPRRPWGHTSASGHPAARRSRHSTGPPSRPADAMTARPDSARSTTQVILRLSFSTRTDTASNPS